MCKCNIYLFYIVIIYFIQRNNNVLIVKYNLSSFKNIEIMLALWNLQYK